MPPNPQRARKRPPQDPLDEMVDRVRRIETRLTQLMLSMGVGTQAQKPTFDEGDHNDLANVQLPSPHSSMREILDSIPETWDGEIEVFLGDECIVTIDHRPRSATSRDQPAGD